ncbi:hypothetical protein GTQ40_01185 [Flavobacteriaceae bacterium R38]|nr:hypothetical protein [Flavobacteriaceae bacterium R38]
MKIKQITFSIFFLIPLFVFSQYDYEPSKEFPYGRANPEAAQQIKDFEPLLGVCDCKSVNRKPDQSWAEPVDMKWTFKYIMNGKGIQDETLKSDGGHSGSIRQYIADSSRWYVHYYSSNAPTATLGTWEGNKKDGKLVFYREQAAPNGMEGYYRLTFYDISKKGYKWIGEWVDKTEKIVFPTWKITCLREETE